LARSRSTALELKTQSAKKLDYYHALEREHAGLVLLTEAETALGQLIAGKRMSAAELDKLLAD
jgi:hypothetical protein